MPQPAVPAESRSRVDVPRDDEPPPEPPKPPTSDECCHSGCDPCVFDLYDAALERYRVALAAWEARHAGKRRRGR
ncbi:oxidoreductase-like domain-containing protein [Paraburkholderia phosphatilytica]|uniref:oxidoreductase-like domain-containing protein n=1 Tax=Paraburkholderia phosphatilytica TaxID=2282883 RepID=UPI000E4B0629|nr:oxidoreductase-like domain-containing protein [Paraburkholderia phosphatilytica]